MICASSSSVHKLPVSLTLLALVFEVARCVLVAFGVRATYLAIQLGMPPIQVPPVSRAAPSWRAATLAAVAIAITLAVAVLVCSPWPIVAAAAAVAAHASLLLFPNFGSASFWRMHYRGLALMGGGVEEEWFCSAEQAAQVVGAHASAETHAVVVGNGLSALPALLCTRCALVSAVDTSPAAISAMRARWPCVKWHLADACNLRGLYPDGSVDVVCDKGTFAALLERSTEACGMGFEEARRVLRPGGLLITIALVAISAHQLAISGFELVASYRIPAINALPCQPSRSVFAQVVRKSEEVEEVGRSADFSFEGAGYDEDAAAIDLPLLTPLAS